MSESSSYLLHTSWKKIVVKLSTVFFWSLRVLNEKDMSDTEEEVEETNTVTLGPEKRKTQQELIDVDRSYFVNEEGAASVSKENFKTCSDGNGGRKRKKVEMNKKWNKCK